MKTITLFLSFVIALINNNTAAQNKLKRYDVKSGIVEYVTTTSGNVMGSTITGSGTEKLFFKEWGAVELKETKLDQTTTTKIFGNEKTESTHKHSMNKLDNGESFSVGFDNQKIYLGRDMAMDMSGSLHPEGDVGDVGKNMVESMGGKKLGNEDFLGYNCEVWELMGGKQWIYKGVMLKMEMTALGIKTVTRATSIRWNISVPDAHFSLPDFPIHKNDSYMMPEDYQSSQNEMEEGMDKLRNLSFEEWKAAATQDDPEMKEASDEELRQTYDMMQKMLKLRQGK
ncbi:hypothetical protein ACT3CD_00210 [Geofilum sp. OHC36d9]|uniref:hypothetical protein n=1 Tax=Geofilum sp. OHC36d9 TaxID=3458413 RepID=UPI004033399C